jgi:VIT1/CCC1 family predicted Fe2+/Mn2+ transporter
MPAMEADHGTGRDAGRPREAGRPRGVDPTAIREQPALTTSTGAIWLIVGGLFAVVSVAVLIPMATLPNGTVAVVAAIVVALLYLGMLVVQFAMPPGRRRLGAQATAMLLMAAVALGAVLFVAAGAATVSTA